MQQRYLVDSYPHNFLLQRENVSVKFGWFALFGTKYKL